MDRVAELCALTERGRVEDTFAHDLGRIDVFETDVRLVFFSRHFDREGAPPLYLIGRGHKLIMPKPVLVPMIGRILFALGHTVMPDLLEASTFLH